MGNSSNIFRHRLTGENIISEENDTIVRSNGSICNSIGEFFLMCIRHHGRHLVHIAAIAEMYPDK